MSHAPVALSAGLDQSEVTRRAFVKAVAPGVAALALGVVARPASLQAQAKKKGPFKAAVIGHTNHGNYGHGLDVCFNEREDMQVVAIADADPEGRKQAAMRAKAPRQYADFQELLAKEKPEFVSVAPRWSGAHFAMVKAAVEAGAHVYCEKPFTQNLVEADALVDAAQKAKVRIAVAHQMRLAPNIVHLHKAIEDGLIGDLLELRAHGKQDQRAGGEDMIVLGTHLFQLMRYFAGEPQWCSARVLQGGKDIQVSDARRPAEDVGLVAGDEVFAHFAFPSGVNATFTSRGKGKEAFRGWGIELIGSKATAKIAADIPPTVSYRKHGPGTDRVFGPVPGDPFKAPKPELREKLANGWMIDDLVAAVRDGREPACNGREALGAIEMVMAVYQSSLAANRVKFPLARREHPLAKA